MKVEPRVIANVSNVTSGPAPSDIAPDAARGDLPKEQGSDLSTALPNPRREDLAKIVEKMNETLKIFNRALQFRVADSGRVIIKVIDQDSGEIIRQIPPEQLVDMYEKFDTMIGVLVDRKV